MSTRKIYSFALFLPLVAAKRLARPTSFNYKIPIFGILQTFGLASLHLITIKICSYIYVSANVMFLAHYILLLTS